MSEYGAGQRPPVVLIANDQEWSSRSLESIFAPHGFAVLRAYTGRQALELARSAQVDALVLDFAMPDLSGVDICRELRSDPRFSVTTPIILTTAGTPTRSQRLEAFAVGAWEFYSEPLDGEALLLKLDTYIRAKREGDRARSEALLDEATGLYNLRGLARRAREIGAEAVRRRSPLACVVFAPMAADAGLSPEEVGTRIAEHLGEIFRRTGRSSDAIGRLGPMEFGIIAPATEQHGAERLIERLRALVESEPMQFDGEEHRISFRAAYSAVPDFAESSVDAVELLLQAARGLRQEKKFDIPLPNKPTLVQ